MRLVDDSPPEDCHAPAILFQPDCGVDDEPKVRESLTVSSGARQGATGADDVEEQPRGVPTVRAPRRSSSFRPLPRRHSTILQPPRPRKQRCGLRPGYMATSVPHTSSSPAERGSITRVLATTFHPTHMATCRRHPIRASPSPRLGRHHAASCPLATCTPAASCMPKVSVAALHQRKPLSPLGAGVRYAMQGRNDLLQLA